MNESIIINYTDQFTQIDTRKFRYMLLVADENHAPIMEFVTAKGCWVFPLSNAFEVHRCNEFLRSIVSIDVKFTGYREYAKLIVTCGIILEEKQRGLMERIATAIMGHYS